MNSDIIINTINTLFGNMFSSIDSTLYTALDTIAFINSDIFNSHYFDKIVGTNSTNGFIIIANSLLLGFIIYYIISYWLSSFGIIQENIKNPSHFFFKIILAGILMNSSVFICEGLVSINSLLSDSIRELGEKIFNININFTELIKQLNDIIFYESITVNVFSIDGILKLIFSFSFFNIIFSYSIRYIFLKLLIIISPFAFLSLSTRLTSNFFKCWFKSFIALLFTELIISIILIIIFSIILTCEDITGKLLLIGSIFALIKTNSLVREFIGGISTDFSDSLYLLRSMSQTF